MTNSNSDISKKIQQTLIKKDLKQNLNALYLGLTFSGMWLLIYFVLLKM